MIRVFQVVIGNQKLTLCGRAQVAELITVLGSVLVDAERLDDENALPEQSWSIRYWHEPVRMECRHMTTTLQTAKKLLKGRR